MPEITNRTGNRYYTMGRSNTRGWGGVRVKNLLVEKVRCWLHADAAGENFNGMLKSVNILRKITVLIMLAQPITQVKGSP